MLVKQVETEAAPPQETEEVVMLSKEDLQAIVKALMELSYNKGTDIYECPPGLIEMADELGVT